MGFGDTQISQGDSVRFGHGGAIRDGIAVLTLGTHVLVTDGSAFTGVLAAQDLARTRAMCYDCFESMREDSSCACECHAERAALEAAAAQRLKAVTELISGAAALFTGTAGA